MDLRAIYNKGLKDDKYFSLGYNMTRFNELYRNLNKAQYIPDKIEQQERIRELLKDPKDTSGYVAPRQPQKTYEDLGFDTYDEMQKHQNSGMIFNNWVWVSYKRFLELENHITERLQQADTLADDQYMAICFLIDQQYNYHTGIFDDPQADYIFSGEYNQFIYDVMQLKINEIAKLKTAPIDKVMREIVKKPLKWNADKQIIGTLFGVLKDAGIVEGTQKDIAKGLSGLFSNLSESTLLNNLKLKENTTENKVYYSKETERIVKGELLDYIKGTVKD